MTAGLSSKRRVRVVRKRKRGGEKERERKLQPFLTDMIATLVRHFDSAQSL